MNGWTEEEQFDERMDGQMKQGMDERKNGWIMNEKVRDG